jgi:preprotein translocase subunit SecG
MTWIPYVTMFLLMLVGLLLIFIILLQRGRGGGLAGALGGMGGTSAFGTRAGDVFTKITVVLAIIWTILAAGNVYALRITGKQYKGGTAVVPTATAPALDKGTAGDALPMPSNLDTPDKREEKGDSPLKKEPAPTDTPAAQPTERPEAPAEKTPEREQKELPETTPSESKPQ